MTAKEESAVHAIDNEEDDDEGLMSSVGFMFDASHAKEVQRLAISPQLTLAIKTIGDQPGHKQSGQYLWPAAKAAARYLVTQWETLAAKSVLELGAGCGVAGLTVSTLPGIEEVVFTDYDMGTLSLIEESVELNEDLVSPSLLRVLTVFLEWGKISSSLALSPPTVRRFHSDFNGDFSVHSQFPLIIGTDLIYCKDVVRPLFLTVKHFLGKGNANTRFVLVTSFNLGTDIEELIDEVCHELHIQRKEIHPLANEEYRCRIEHYTLSNN